MSKAINPFSLGLTTLFVLIASTLLPTKALGYSGENMRTGGPWHHQDITCRALIGDQGCGLNTDVYKAMSHNGTDNLFSPSATNAIAWHADYIDSYLYNPIWWIIGDGNSVRSPEDMRHRYLAAKSNHWALTSLHFDDLNSTTEIHQTWSRYLNGTIIGLEWAADKKDRQAAYNILGLSLHAVQDFYSHSTWMDDPARRNNTYTYTSPFVRNEMSLQTGAFETHHGTAVNHGTYDFTCGFQTRPVISTGFDIFCADVFPTANIEFCEEYRECDQAEREDVRIGIDLGDIDVGFVILNPPGINLDNTTMAKVGGDKRRITSNYGQTFRTGHNLADDPVFGVDIQSKCGEIVGRGFDCQIKSDLLFANAKHLAVNASQQWMAIINTYMNEHEPEFWKEVRDCLGCGTIRREKSTPAMIRQFEDYHQFPFQFITAGFNEPAKKLGDDKGWYLRIEVETAHETGDGTNSDIRAIGNRSRGESFVLDYLALSDPHSQSTMLGLTYDDLEPGDKQVYTVGPFAEVPNQLTLHNDSGDADSVVNAFIDEAGMFFEDAFDSLGSFFLNEHDYVGHKGWAANRRELDALIARGGRKTLRINGGAEGSYEIDIKVRRTPWRGRGEQATWREYQIELVRMYCVDESDVDGLTAADEPFFFFSLSYYGINEAEFKREGPYTNIGVDDGDVREKRINKAFRSFRLPSEGAVYLAVEARESDDEGSSKRNELYRKFKGVVDARELADYPQFRDEFGKSIGAPWKIKTMNIYAFQRAMTPKYGKVYEGKNINMWLENNQSKQFTLNKSAIETLDAGSGMLNPVMILPYFPPGGIFGGINLEGVGDPPANNPVKEIPGSSSGQLGIEDGINRDNIPQWRPDISDLVKIKASCAESIQGKISWSYGNNKTWGDHNVKKLCKGNETSSEPALCFRDVMHGIPGQRVKYKGLKRPDAREWTWQEAVELCQGTKNRTSRQLCFTKLVASGQSVPDAISKCGTGLK